MEKMLRKELSCSVAALVCLMPAFAAAAPPTVNVWVNFTSNFGSLLDLGAADASVDAYSDTEKEIIQEKVILELNRIYSGYNVQFSMSDPGGDRDVISIGDTYPNPLGPYGSTSTNGIGNYITNATAHLYPRNFNNLMGFLPPPGGGNARAFAMGIEMGQVASHELGHIFGLNHWLKFGVDSINPTNYLNINDREKTSIMAVTSAPYGVETKYNLNPFERAMYDITGGTAEGGISLVNNPVLEVNESTDAGDTTITARPLAFTQGESSQRPLAMIRGHLQNSAGDIDNYSFTTTSPGQLSVAVFSGTFYNSNQTFNERIRLIGPDGTTVVADFDDLYYDGGTYNQPSYVDFGGFTINVPKGGDDPFMVNVPIGVGQYFLEISPVSGNDIGDGYQFLAEYSGTIAPVPEPAGAAMLLAGTFFVIRRSKWRVKQG